VSGLFAALTGAASTEPPRLGAAGVPLLEEVREVEVREVEEEAGSNSEHQEQQ